MASVSAWITSSKELQETTISYFKKSLELNNTLLQLQLPANAHLFSANAVSMYSNILTHMALNLLSKHPATYKHNINNNYPLDAICTSLQLVMTQDIFTFRDMTFKQLNSTAMGTPPAPPYATIYYGIHEQLFIPQYSACLLLYT